MRGLFKLVEITAEGKIVAALIEAPKSYAELKSTTNLSDRWLSKKLRELSASGLIGHQGKNYQLKNPAEIIDSDPIFAQYVQGKASLKAKARLIVEEISRNDQIVSVILFGSLAKGKTTEESDIDLLIITEVETEEQLNNTVYDLMFKHDVPLEPVFLTYEDLIINLQARTAFIFGLLEGYQVLYDRGGVETLLSIKKKEIEEEWFFDKETQTWIQKKLAPTLKPLKTS
jgi:predicted nucleotidyltransferase